jgi:hypothetical protein
VFLLQFSLEFLQLLFLLILLCLLEMLEFVLKGLQLLFLLSLALRNQLIDLYLILWLFLLNLSYLLVMGHLKLAEGLLILLFLLVSLSL